MIRYSIEFLSEWHIGSGLGAGAQLDATILKDSNGMPYIPGKTIKGLLKDAMRDISEVKSDKINQVKIVTIFGGENEDKSTSPGIAKFSDAIILTDNYNEILHNDLQAFLFKSVASTAIDKRGVANDKSLRTKEVCMPLILEGEIHDVDEFKDIIETGFKWVRSLGVNRNRGLGRCKITIN